MGALLEKIDSPDDLKALSLSELAALAKELREVIIDVVSRRGGHLASNLGVTELTLALHYVLDFATDRVLWDVGHQCYAHKLVTGRRERFDTLRQADGISGFPDPDESPYDLFKVGHAGTAISTAMGMALADQAAGADRKVVAVVGDASIVNGLSLEGINNAALLERQFLLVLNDNSMAIDVTQGAMARALDRVRLTRTYHDLKHAADNMLRHVPLGQEIGDALRHLHGGLRSALHGQQAVEALGFRYFGPVDGHNIGELVRVLRKVTELDRPALLHVHTEKGRGYEYAVENPTAFHSPGSWTVKEGEVIFSRGERPAWTSAFSETLIAAARGNPKVVAITAAMPDGTGLSAFRQEFPGRYFDVGISEAHAVAMAAGLARAGARPVVAVYSTFAQRAFDQLFQEVALQNLPVVLCLDRAGLVGSDGAVHHGFLDLAFLRPLSGMTLMAPADRPELAAALAAVKGLGDEGLHVGVVNARFAKPLDAVAIGRLLTAGRPVLCCEDHARAGGFGSGVLELAVERGWPTTGLGVAALPDRFIAHASRPQQLAEAGLDADGLAQGMRDLIAARTRRKAASRAKR